METNEILTNEEVMNAAEEVVTESSGKTLKALGIFGGAVLIGGLAYKYAVKPIIAKVKAKKEPDDFSDDADDIDIVDAEIESEE